MDLRSHEYEPLWEAGKIWLQREFTPLTEKYATARPIPAAQDACRLPPGFQIGAVAKLVPSQVANKPAKPQVRKAIVAEPIRAQSPMKDVHSQAPPYESWFAKLKGMTEEDYDELDDENKKYFVATYFKD
jgi:hypothetical protein